MAGHLVCYWEVAKKVLTNSIVAPGMSAAQTFVTVYMIKYIGTLFFKLTGLQDTMPAAGSMRVGTMDRQRETERLRTQCRRVVEFFFVEDAQLQMAALDDAVGQRAREIALDIAQELIPVMQAAAAAPQRAPSSSVPTTSTSGFAPYGGTPQRLG